jgi:hypothetical protein
MVAIRGATYSVSDDGGFRSGWHHQPGKYADVIAVRGDVLRHIQLAARM